jgi:hypothetical protein
MSSIHGPTLPPIQWVPGALSLGVKRPGEPDHSPSTSVEVKKTWIYTSTLPYAFIAWCSISEAQGQIYLFYLKNACRKIYMQHKLYFSLLVHVKPQDSLLQTVNAAIFQKCSFLMICLLLSVRQDRDPFATHGVLFCPSCIQPFSCFLDNAPCSSFSQGQSKTS